MKRFTSFARMPLAFPLAAALAAALATPGCLGTETGNPPFAPEVGYGGYEPMGLAPDPTLSRARMGVDEVTLVDCEGARIPMLRRLVIDFVTGEASVAESLSVPSGQYCGIELSIAACRDPDLCRTVDPSSVELLGVRRVDAADIEIRDDLPTMVALEGSFEMSEMAGGVLLALDRNLLTSGLAISTLPVEPDGVARVDATTNADRLPTLRDGLRAAFSLRRDLDGDGVLDPEEIMATPLATPVATP